MQRATESWRELFSLREVNRVTMRLCTDKFPTAKACFRAIDKDGGGTVDRKEMAGGLFKVSPVTERCKCLPVSLLCLLEVRELRWLGLTPPLCHTVISFSFVAVGRLAAPYRTRYSVCSCG